MMTLCNCILDFFIFMRKGGFAVFVTKVFRTPLIIVVPVSQLPYNAFDKSEFPMNIVIFTTSYHIGANIACRMILESDECHVTGIVQTRMASFSKRTLRTIGKFIRLSGLSYFLKTSALAIWQKFTMKFSRFFLPAARRKYFQVSEIAGEKNIPFLQVEDINDPIVIDFVKKSKADLGVSVLLMQKVKRNLLSVPKFGCINLHPGLLPQYKGTFMHFWPLFHREKWGGVTVHRMTEELDTGKILAVKRFKIKRHYSQQCLIEKSAETGGKLMIKVIRNIAKKNEFSVSFAKWKQKLSYFSYPSLEAVRKLSDFGRKFLKKKHLFRM